jgi:PKD repeat protein
MKNLTFIIITLLAFTAASCTQEETPNPVSPKTPQACIEIQKDTFTINEGIRFFSCGEKVDSYYWDFGDGVISEEKIPVHQFAKPGTYLVELIVNKDLHTVKTVVPVTVVKPQHSNNGEVTDNTDGVTPTFTPQDLVLRP